MRGVMIDPQKCVGCKQCEIACAVEHSRTKNLFAMFAEEIISKPRIHVEAGAELLTFPNKCRHCDPAPCLEICPTSALYREKEIGSVVVDYGKCIACGMCAIACPFGIIAFGKDYAVKLDRDVNIKCDDCFERQKKGREPACVEVCKTNALMFGEVNELIAEKRKGLTIAITKSPDEPEKRAIPPNIQIWRETLKTLNQANR